MLKKPASIVEEKERFSPRSNKTRFTRDRACIACGLSREKGGSIRGGLIGVKLTGIVTAFSG